MVNASGVNSQSAPDREERQSAECPPDNKLPENSQANLDARLDHAIEETFPTSDPVSVTITKGPEPDRADQEHLRHRRMTIRANRSRAQPSMFLIRCGRRSTTLQIKRPEQPMRYFGEASTTSAKQANAIRRLNATTVKASKFSGGKPLRAHYCRFSWRRLRVTRWPG